ncbi:MAG: glycosyltransferase family 2 protein, partial [Anaerolineales bacterium]
LFGSFLLKSGAGDFIVRLDAHSTPDPNYVTRCITALETGQGENVGGVWQIAPGGDGWLARSIAAAAAHPLGVGDARYRFTEQAQLVDTVPFGAFRRTLVDRIGTFDETLLTNEDYEFNVRVRQSGGRVWLDPAIQSTYFARGTLGALARQYLRYGYWKAQMLRRYPETIRWRQATPPLSVLNLIVLALLAVWFPWVCWLLALEAFLYALALLAAGVQVGLKNRDFLLSLGVPLAIAIMHISWGSALLWSLIVKHNE